MREEHLCCLSESFRPRSVPAVHVARFKGLTLFWSHFTLQPSTPISSLSLCLLQCFAATPPMRVKLWKDAGCLPEVI